MYQPPIRNNRPYHVNGQWQLFWYGEWTPLSADEAERYLKQESETLRLDTKELSGHALDWAVAHALQYTPHIQVDDVEGKMLPGGVVLPNYEDFVIIAHFVRRTRFGPFRPSTDYSQGGPLLDQYRISTEIAGDGWAALLNDTFCPNTYELALHGDTRLIAGMRCLVRKLMGPCAYVPAELVEPTIRRRMLAK